MMKVYEYLLSDVAKEYDDYSITIQDTEGNILFYGDKYDLITSDEYGELLILKTEENKKEKYLIFMTFINEEN